MLVFGLYICRYNNLQVIPMPNPPASLKSLISRRSALLAEIANVGEFRPGSLVEHFTRCGKAGCRCAKPGAAGHGPVWSLTRKADSKTISWRVPPDALPLVQAQVAEYKRFRALEKEFIEVSEQLADARVESEGSASGRMAKKGALVKRSKRSSSVKSSEKPIRS